MFSSSTVGLFLLYIVVKCDMFECTQGDLDVKNKEVCTFDEGILLTDCSNRNLTYIPVVNNLTQTLNMSGNKLMFIDTVLFNNISHLHVQQLDLSNNQILTIVNGSFSVLKSLWSLNMNHNLLTNDSISNLTTGISSMLDCLYLENVTDQPLLPYDAMSGLQYTRLKYLSLMNNQLEYVKMDELFKYVPNLLTLNLARNMIHDITTTCTGSTGICSEVLEDLDLSYNDFTRLPLLCRESAVLPRLKSLNFTHNCIKTINSDLLHCLTHLEKLDMSWVRLEEIPSDTFTGLRSLRDLQLKHVETLRTFRPYVFNILSLESLNISRNHLHFGHDVYIFRNNTDLKFLDMSYNFLQQNEEEDWERMLQSTPNLITLHLRSTYLLFAPNAISLLLPKLEELYMTDNKLEFFTPNYFHRLKKLKILDVKGNQITHVSSEYFPPSFMGHLQLLELSFNPYACDCSILWFLKFAKRYDNILAHFPWMYHCSNGVTIKNFTRSLGKSCLIKQQTALILKCWCYTSMLMLVIISVIYRYRWRLRYFMYILRFHRRNYSSVNQTSSMHDVYISCADQDFNIVYYQIVNVLEDKGLNIYFPYRDATPGTLIIRESLEHLDRSKFILLCISDSFAQDTWCEFEACMALERWVCEGTEKQIVIVVVLEEMNVRNVTRVINQLTRNINYLKWDENRDTNVLFWRKLESILR